MTDLVPFDDELEGLRQGLEGMLEYETTPPPRKLDYNRMFAIKSKKQKSPLFMVGDECSI